MIAVKIPGAGGGDGFLTAMCSVLLSGEKCFGMNLCAALNMIMIGANLGPNY